MKILHTTTFIEQPFTSDAHIFSECPVSREVVSDLLYAQTVVEAKWLGNFPAFIFPWQDDIRHWTQVCEYVRLVHPESWDVVDKSDAFLLNSKMYDLCKSEGRLPVELAISTSEELRRLFESHMFVVAAAGNTA